jgi:uncharacterized protein YndB with AHSA1/START domain
VPTPFTFDRHFQFAISPDELWATLSQTDAYPEWWSWLRSFDADGLHDGAVARCVIRAPLPYVLRCNVRVRRAVEPELVDTMVEGDLEGPARLEIAPGDNGGSDARLSWSLVLRDPVLRRLAVLGRPAMTWAHDRVVSGGLRQFEQRALDGRRAR